MKVLFFHSGPGLNSNPEKHLLTERFRRSGYDLKCWNEPSTLRPDDFVPLSHNAYDNYLNSAEAFLLKHYSNEPLVIIGHSFGAQAVRYLAKNHPGKINHVVFVSTNLSVESTDRNTFAVIISDFEQVNDNRAVDLKAILNDYTGKFDDNTKRGMEIVSQNPNWFNYYWCDREIMAEYLSHYTSPYYTLDFKGYFDIRESWYPTELSQCDVKATSMYGQHDILVSNPDELAMINDSFKSMNAIEFKRSAHYPHIEETDLFIEKLQEYIS